MREKSVTLSETLRRYHTRVTPLLFTFAVIERAESGVIAVESCHMVTVGWLTLRYQTLLLHYGGREYVTLRDEGYVIIVYAEAAIRDEEQKRDYAEIRRRRDHAATPPLRHHYEERRRHCCHTYYIMPLLIRHWRHYVVITLYHAVYQPSLHIFHACLLRRYCYYRLSSPSSLNSAHITSCLIFALAPCYAFPPRTHHVYQ